MSKNRKIFIMGICIVAAVVIIGVIRAGGILPLLFAPSVSRYPVRGVDVSHYQGEIDWEILAGQGIDFAFIKATEGSSHRDKRFAENWDGAWDTGIAVGAYHFFSFESEGAGQAGNFIETVGKKTGMLVPVVDIEFYGNWQKTPPDAEGIRAELQVMLDQLEAYYGVRPMIYTTMEFHRKYIWGYFEGYPLWIRNIFYCPDWGRTKGWVFWQYSGWGKMEGYQGEEECIDLNVFWGGEEEFRGWLEMGR